MTLTLTFIDLVTQDLMSLETRFEEVCG